MKRAREEIDPVYPFDVQQLTPMPPFVDAGSGIEVNGLKLSVKYLNPITTNNGALALKIGDGLDINGKGELISSELSGKVVLPLMRKGKDLCLNFSSPLYVNSEALDINAGKTLQLGDTLDLKEPLEPIVITENGSLAIQLGEAMKILNGTLSINTEAPLVVENGLLKLKIGPCFSVNDNKLILQTSNGITQSDGTLQLKTPIPPISIVNDALQLNIGNSLSVKNNLLEISDPTRPLEIVNSKLGLKFSNNFDISNGALNCKQPVVPLKFNENGNINLQYDNSLKVVNDALSINVGNTLSTSSAGQLNVNVSPYGYLAINDDGLALRYNPDTFETNSSSLKVLVNPLDSIKAEPGGLTLLKKPPIVTIATDDGYNTALTLNYDPNVFKVENTRLTLKTLPSASTFFNLKMGYKELNTYDILVTLPNSRIAKVSAFCSMSCSAGIVTGTIQVRGRAGYWPKGGSSISEGIRFGLVICPTSDVDAVANLSGFPKTTYIPDEAGTPAKFTPNHWAGIDTTVSLNSSTNWYVATENLPCFVSSEFVPGGTNSLKFYTAKLNICSASVNSNLASFKALYCEFVMWQESLGSNFFDSNIDPDTFFITPAIPFQYLAEEI